MSTLVLGGTGFIGARIARRLVERGERVVCLDLIPEAPAVASLRDRVTLVRGDVTRIDGLLSVIKAHRVQRIAHLAYLLNTESDRDPHLAIRVNALGTSNVFEAARLLDVERVVYASSITVYGEQSLYGERPITEEDRPSPPGIYGAAKLLNEYQAAVYRRTFGLSLAGIRIGIIFGHGRLRGAGMWAGDFASHPAVGKPADLPFGREAQASMVYVEDVAEVVVRALLAPTLRHGVYNTGGDAASVGELADLVSQEIPGARFSFGAGRARSPHLLDSTRAETEFEWKRPSLLERLRDHIAEARAAGG